uniref:LRR receptor-like serine/threonine-protein kinase n=1 Tax=Aegilops tauschii subsp. strangulata TaxID=200361 RepID=A0A453AEK7_AEGTS
MHGWVPKFQLNTLRLSWCNLDKSMITEPHFLHTQNHLQFLDLSNNNLPGSMPNWLFTNKTTLVYLNLANNSLVGSLDLIGQPQTNLKQVNVSSNLVEGQLPTNIGFMFPHLIILDVSRNTISGTIPPALCNSSIQLMDLSKNRFTGKVPACLFTDCYAMNILKLSNNTLGGKILDGASSFSGNLWAIHLGNNKFEGTLPRNLSGNVQIMDLHDNKMSGELDTSLWCLPSLQALSLANNGLTGGIHPEISTLTDLMMLDLSGNYFTGRLPNCGTMVYLTFLSVSGNSLSGSPGAFFNSSYITALDLSNNQFTGNLEWAQHLSQVSVLLLSRNKFEGHISSNFCHLQYLSIIDISHNRLSGSVPPCIGGIPFEPLDPYEHWPAAGSITYGGGEDGLDFVYTNNYDLPGFTFTTKGQPGLGLETASDPQPHASQRPNAPRPDSGPITGYKWVRRGCLDPRLGFPATTREVRRFAHSAGSIQICPPPPPLLQSFAAVVMGDRRADKRPMEVSDPEAERRRERELRDKAKRVMRERSGGREAREERGGSRDQGGREGDWGPPPWWIQ